MKDKDLYKLFNHVKIEESEFDEIEEVSDMQKKRIKNKLNKKIKRKKTSRRMKVASTAASVALASLVAINIVTPTFAESIPLVGSIIETLNEKIGIHGDYAEYSQIVNQSVTSKGVTVTINEVVADQSRLMIGYTVNSDHKLKDQAFEDYFSLIGDFKINRKAIISGGSAMGHYIDDYTYVGSETVKVSLYEVPEEFNVDFKISSIMDTKGKWKFAFNVSKEEIAKKSTIFNPNQEVEFPDSIVTVDQVEFSPIGTYIALSGDYKTRPDQPGDIMEYDFWIAYDDKGVELTFNGMGSGTSGDKDFNSEMGYAKANEIPPYLTILPLKITPTGGGGIRFKDGKEIPIEIETKQPTDINKMMDGIYPKELAQGKFGKLIINEVVRADDTTIIKFTAEGIAPHFQATSLRIKDDQGETIMPVNGDIRAKNENSNEFIAEFKTLDSNKEYYINTTDFDNVEFDQAMMFEIPLEY